MNCSAFSFSGTVSVRSANRLPTQLGASSSRIAVLLRNAVSAARTILLLLRMNIALIDFLMRSEETCHERLTRNFGDFALYSGAGAPTGSIAQPAEVHGHDGRRSRCRSRDSQHSTRTSVRGKARAGRGFGRTLWFFGSHARQLAVPR